MSAPNPPELVLLNYTLPDDSTGSVAVDAAVHEQHSGTAEVTQHQVEKGSQITDHIRPMPDKLSLEVVVTNTPIGNIPTPNFGTSANPNTNFDFSQTSGSRTISGTFTALDFGEQFDRVTAVYDYLRAAVSAGAIWSVTTTLRSYENMAATNLSVPRDAAHGNAIHFTIDFMALRFVSTQTVTALAAPKSDKKKRGNVPTKEPEVKTQEKQKSATEAFLGLLGVGG